MPLHPKAQEFLDQLAAAGMPTLGSLPPAETREAFKGIAAFSGPPEPLASVEHRSIPGLGGDIPLRIYTPEGKGPRPAVVYLHGGGWVIGDFDTHDGICRHLAKQASAMVVSVGYRLAPEHKFPAGAEDCYAATCWVAENAAALGVDAKRIVVGGDSAGGNLTAAVSLMARDRGAPKIALQLLIYPVTDHSYDTASYGENATGYLLERSSMVWFWDHYLKDARDGDNPYASPLRAKDLSGQPPALLITAEFDPLRDEGEAYGKRLREAGVAVTQKRYDGLIHGFAMMTGFFDQAREFVADAAKAIRALPS